MRFFCPFSGAKAEDNTPFFFSASPPDCEGLIRRPSSGVSGVVLFRRHNYVIPTFGPHNLPFLFLHVVEQILPSQRVL